MNLRKGLFWFHLAVGTVTGVIIFNMAVSGLFIAYERQILDWLEKDVRTVAVSGDVQRLDVETLLDRMAKERPEVLPLGVVLYADPAAAVKITLEGGGVLYVDPSSGRVAPDHGRMARAFFHFMTRWHRWLAQEGEGREVGKAITGAGGLSFFLLMVTGLILWIPRSWTRKAVRASMVPNLKARGKARDWNWHLALGLWFSPLILLITLTGTVISYTWAQRALFVLTGNDPPPVGKREVRAAVTPPTPAPDWRGMNGLVAVAEGHWPDWKMLQFRLSASPSAPVIFNFDRGDGTRPDQRASLKLDRRTGEVLEWEPYASWNGGRQLRSWMVPLHTGKVVGFFGQTLIAASGLAALILVWTGFSLALRRFAAFRKRQTDLS